MQPETERETAESVIMAAQNRMPKFNGTCADAPAPSGAYCSSFSKKIQQQLMCLLMVFKDVGNAPIIQLLDQNGQAAKQQRMTTWGGRMALHGTHLPRHAGCLV